MLGYVEGLELLNGVVVMGNLGEGEGLLVDVRGVHVDGQVTVALLLHLVLDLDNALEMLFVQGNRKVFQFLSHLYRFLVDESLALSFLFGLLLGLGQLFGSSSFLLGKLFGGCCRLFGLLLLLDLLLFLFLGEGLLLLLFFLCFCFLHSLLLLSSLSLSFKFLHLLLGFLLGGRLEFGHAGLAKDLHSGSLVLLHIQEGLGFLLLFNPHKLKLGFGLGPLQLVLSL